MAQCDGAIIFDLENLNGFDYYPPQSCTPQTDPPLYIRSKNGHSQPLNARSSPIIFDGKKISFKLDCRRHGCRAFKKYYCYVSQKIEYQIEQNKKLLYKVVVDGMQFSIIPMCRRSELGSLTVVQRS